MDDDVGIYRLCFLIPPIMGERILRRVHVLQRLADSVELAVNMPAVEFEFNVNRKAVRNAPLASVYGEKVLVILDEFSNARPRAATTLSLPFRLKDVR